jgi:thiol-disulfide isomerase/thioredoxin
MVRTLANCWARSTPFAGALAAAGVLMLAAAGLRAEENAPPLPRYKLQVGQELRYQGSDTFKYEGGEIASEGSWNVWVVRVNDDGSWRLLLRNVSTMKQSGGRERKTPTLVSCDIYPSGKLSDNDSLGFQINPAKLLPRLPESAAELAAGWSSRDERMDEVTKYAVNSERTKDKQLVLQAQRESPMDVIYGIEYRDTYTFDVDRGLPQKIETHTKQTYGFNGQGEGTVELEAIETHDQAWCESFAAEAERYFSAYLDYGKAVLDDAPDGAADKAIAALKTVGEEVKSPIVREQIDSVLEQHKSLAFHYADQAKKRAAILNKPAADWQADDFAGKSHALADYRGQVVVLDFWYRGCGWCVRAMPQMNQIAAHFAGKPVAVLGVNTDRVDEDAQFVIDKMGLKYPNLKGAEIPGKYHVQGFPTLLIIDQKGVLREVHTGYSPALKEKVVESIEKLLQE